MTSIVDAPNCGTREIIMSIRITPGERQQLHDMAVARGITVSDLIRRGLQLQGFELTLPLSRPVHLAQQREAVQS